MRANKPIRGEVWRVQFDPLLGAEIQKTRPAVVMNTADVGMLPLCIVVPLTDWKLIFARATWFVRLFPSLANGLSKESGADTFQVKSVSQERFAAKLGVLTPEEMERIAEAIAFCVGFTAKPGEV